MTRRLLSVALLCYLGFATWVLTARFAAWGDGVSTVVGRVVQGWTVTTALASTGDGIDFIECYGCSSLPGANGYAFGFLCLLVAGCPLAVTAAWERRRGRSLPLPTSWYQTAFVLQCASVGVAAVVLYGFLAFSTNIQDVAHWMSACALADIVTGVPAIFTWRLLHASAFGAPRPLLAGGVAYVLPRVAVFQ